MCCSLAAAFLSHWAGSFVAFLLASLCEDHQVWEQRIMFIPRDEVHTSNLHVLIEHPVF